MDAAGPPAEYRTAVERAGRNGGWQKLAVNDASGYLAAVRDLTETVGALLWIDEVQTGIGRTGAWLAHTASGVSADLITVAKGLGGGIPIGACIATGAAASLLGPGSHGSTFGGNPIAARAGLTVLNVIERDNLLAHVREVGDGVAAALTNVPGVTGVRGSGLLRGVQLDRDIAPDVAAIVVLPVPAPLESDPSPPQATSNRGVSQQVSRGASAFRFMLAP